MEELKIGQVLWLKVRYQIDVVSTTEHPMLIADIQNDYIEVIAIDKTAGKLQQLYRSYNLYIDSKNPKEIVISEDSYAQLNTKLTIQKCNELFKARRTKAILSKYKLDDVLTSYKEYQSANDIDESRIVYMDKSEIISMNINLKD